MKKDIATQLNKVADSTPVVFEWTLMPEQFTGEEMNLSYFGELMRYEPEMIYTVHMPTMVAVNHKQQFKDAYKRGGWPAVKEYHTSVMDKVKGKTPIKMRLN